MSSATGRPFSMSSPMSDRRLSAILHADLTGYVRLMEGAEDRTVGRLKSVRAEVWRPAVEAAGGRIVNIVGDSVLAEFGSAVAAVQAAIDIQERMARFNDRLDDEQRLLFRIGLHLGEVIVDEGQTIFGDAVNVAARIQSMAEPGGIAASSALRDATHLQVDYVFVDGGRHRAKNVSRSLHIYHLCALESASRLGGRARPQPLLWRAAAAASVLLVGGYLVLGANPMTAVDVAALHLSAEQLEQALAERRKADALVAEKRALEEQALRSAEAEAESRRRAGAELERAREARQKAERDLAHLKEAIEARRRAATTEGSREDRTAASAQPATEQATQRRIEAEAAALRDAEAANVRKAVADSVAAHHQRKPPEAPAIGAPQPVAAKEPAAVALSAVAAPNLADGVWRGTYECGRNGNFLPLTLKPEVHVRGGTGTWYAANPSPSNDHTIGLSLSIDGTKVSATRRTILSWSAANASTTLAGALEGSTIRASSSVCTLVLTRDASPVPPARSSVEHRASGSLPSVDGLWRGTYECGRNGNFMPLTLRPEMQVRGGTATWYTASPSPTNDHTIGLSLSIDGTSVHVKRQTILSWTSTNAGTALLSGTFDGNTIRASNEACTMVLARVVSKAS